MNLLKSKNSYANAHWAKGLANELFCCCETTTLHQESQFMYCTMAIRGLANRQSRMSKFYHCRVFALSCPSTTEFPHTKDLTRHDTKSPENFHSTPFVKGPAHPTRHGIKGPENCKAHQCPMLQQLLAWPESCRRLPSCCRRSSFHAWIYMAAGGRVPMEWNASPPAEIARP